MQEKKISSPEGKSKVFLIPSLLDQEGLPAIPPYVIDAVRTCQVIFAEDERTARRFIKKLDKNIVIDDFEWHTISKEDDAHEKKFTEAVRNKKNIGIISEAGCPGIADPGQQLVAIAHQLNAEVNPLSGPISPMLALMGSGMNGQHFEFVGYLPIDSRARIQKLKELELQSLRNNSTKIFIETPYRNNQMLESILENCDPDTKLCVASNLTGPSQSIVSQTISWWKMNKKDLHKQPAIFIIQAGSNKP